MKDYDAGVYEALCECLIRTLKSAEPNPKIVEAAVRFVKDRDISTLPGTNELEAELKESLPFKTSSG
ncbi:MAG: hypothetical protein D6698_08565 [Gammaproteobacteria bacterium]|nr:MAG: hypothetical protein D6698_08565 [Gammaproteobacteria bacterium]